MIQWLISGTVFILCLSTWAKDPLMPNWEYEAQLRIHERVTEQSDGEFADSLKGSFRFEGTLDLNECTQLRGRITTGRTYSQEWDDLGPGLGERDLNLNLRQLYLDTNCLKQNITIQAGALPVYNGGRLGLTTNGWIDGVRVIVKEEASHREWEFSIGALSDLDTPNLFERSWSDINHGEAQVTQKFGVNKNHTVYLNLAKYEDTEFVRAGIRAAVADYLMWVDTVSTEVITAEGEYAGDMQEFIKKWGDKWQFRVFRTNIDDSHTESVTLSKLMKYYYGNGENFFFEAQRDVGPRGRTLVRLREGDAGAMGILEFHLRFGK